MYILKQLFFSISVNIVALGIFTSSLHGSVKILPLFPSTQRIIVNYEITVKLVGKIF